MVRLITRLKRMTGPAVAPKPFTVGGTGSGQNLSKINLFHFSGCGSAVFGRFDHIGLSMVITVATATAVINYLRSPSAQKKEHWCLTVA